MKKFLSIIGVAALLATGAQAQDNTELKAGAVTFIQNVSSNRSLTIAAYPMYAPDIVVNGKKDTFGMGIAFLAPADAIPALQGTVIGNHAFAGLRFDYLAHQAFASTVGVGLKGNLQLLGHNFEGFIHAGANIPISGFGNNNANLGGMAGGGVYTDLYHFSPNAVLGLQASTERWTQFNSQVYLGGPVFNWSF